MIDDTEMAERHSEETADAEAPTSNQCVTRKASGKLVKAPNGKRVKKVCKQQGNGSYLKNIDTQITFAVNGIKYYGMSINKAAGRSGIKPGVIFLPSVIIILYRFKSNIITSVTSLIPY